MNDVVFVVLLPRLLHEVVHFHGFGPVFELLLVVHDVEVSVAESGHQEFLEHVAVVIDCETRERQLRVNLRQRG